MKCQILRGTVTIPVEVLKMSHIVIGTGRVTRGGSLVRVGPGTGTGLPQKI